MDEGFSLIILALILFERIINRKKILKTNIDLVLIAFLTIAIITSLIKRVPFFIFGSQLVLYIKGFCLFYIFIQLNIHKNMLKSYLRFFLAVGLIFFFFGIIDLLIPTYFRTLLNNREYVDYRFGIPSVQSLFTHPVFFGWFMSFCSLFCFAYFINNKKTVYFIGALLFAIGCILSVRAKAIFGLVAGIIITVQIHPQSKIRIKILMIISIIIIFAVFVGTLAVDLLQQKITSYLLTENFMEISRNVLYIKSFEIAVDNFPIGVGMGRYASWLSRAYYSPVYDEYNISRVYGLSREFPMFIVDTFWPMIIGEIGFIGLALFILIIIIFFITIFKAISFPQDPYTRAFQMGAFTVIIECIFESIASPVFVNSPIAFFIFGSVGISYSLHRTNKTLFPIDNP
ncbi:MAG: hypothetical protein JW969_13715 [Spirochaetales bacterium]|nr:hypothetical protein [Spirochaetales bacterium]